MDKTQKLLEVLVDNDIILAGETDKAGILQTKEFQILNLLLKTGPLSEKDIVEKLGGEGIKLRIFSLLGDGLIQKQADQYDLISHLHARILD